jgi:hypothetical protein
MLFLPISRSWVFSRTAQGTYFASALLALALTATVIGVRAAIVAAGTGALNPAAASLVRTLLFPEILGAAVLWAGMWYFWFSFDRSHYLHKAIWFTLLFFLVPLGTVAYYFLVYRRCLSTLMTSPS